MHKIFKKTSLLCLLTACMMTDHLYAEPLQVEVAVTDSQCKPMTLKVPAGKVQFIIRNQSMRALEFEILDGVMVVEERENIAPASCRR